MKFVFNTKEPRRFDCAQQPPLKADRNKSQDLNGKLLKIQALDLQWLGFQIFSILSNFREG